MLYCVIYTILDDPLSMVHAHFDHTEGLLSASIVTHTDHYYIEPSHRHFSGEHEFHMISYRGSDIKYNLTGLVISHTYKYIILIYVRRAGCANHMCVH